MAGIVRRKRGTGFVYVDPKGRVVRDTDTLSRIRSLVIPPAWRDVWICPFETGHLQAVGIDARGRKQYRYHSLYRQVRDATKYSRMAAFGEALPGIRARVEHDMRKQGLPREKVLATITRLLEFTCIRIGNDEYAKQNESFGLTTMQDRHVKIKGASLKFCFKGKSGQEHEVELQDPRLAKIVRACQCIPGEDLFQYHDGSGHRGRVRSEDVNNYLREIGGQDFTAKDYRTWNGARQVALALEAMGPADSETSVRRNIADAVKEAASSLGNRAATCRKYYVHPAVLDAYADQTLFEVMKRARPKNGLSREEVAILKLFKAHKPKPVRQPELEVLLKKSLKRAA
jgi:DNA topoisomerase-1